MLSAAKHLLCPIENKQKQILRVAQDDTIQGLSRSLLKRQSPLSFEWASSLSISLLTQVRPAHAAYWGNVKPQNQ